MQPSGLRRLRYAVSAFSTAGRDDARAEDARTCLTLPRVTAHAIDEEVRRLIDSNYTRAKSILETNMDKLHKMAEALIKYETIDETQIKDIMDGRDPRPPADWDDSPTAPAGGGGRSREREAPEAPIGKPASQH